MPKKNLETRSTGKFILAFVLLYAIALFVFDLGPQQTSAPNIAANDNHPALTQQSITHILYGDARGGGHKFGSGKPCKSEFPENWSDEKIIETITAIAANDNINWREEDNGYFVTESLQDNVRIRVVLNDDKTRIITAYPTNVKRNPCPANDH